MNLRDFTSSFGRPSLTISTLGEASSSPDEESGGAVTVAVVVGALAVAGVAGYLLLAGDGNGASSSDSFGVLHRADGRKMTKADIKHLHEAVRADAKEVHTGHSMEEVLDMSIEILRSDGVDGRVALTSSDWPAVRRGLEKAIRQHRKGDFAGSRRTIERLAGEHS